MEPNSRLVTAHPSLTLSSRLKIQYLQAIRMVQFILKTFAQDEEIQTIHLPIIFAAILDIVDVSASSGSK